MDNTNFNSVYNDFFSKSFLFVKSYVHDKEVAEDIVIEALVKLWTILKKENNVNIAPLLFTMLKNSALDYLKHEKVKLSTNAILYRKFNEEIDIRLSTLKASDPKEIFSTEVAQIIHQTLATLPKKTRYIFEMSRFEGKPNKEIADIYGITIKGVDYHIFRALNVLRISLKDYLPICFLGQILLNIPIF